MEGSGSQRRRRANRKSQNDIYLHINLRQIDNGRGMAIARLLTRCNNKGTVAADATATVTVRAAAAATVAARAAAANAATAD